MRKPSKKEKGQAIPMVTLSLVALCGMMGLAVDLGWSFFVKRSAQTAADAAAQAAVQQVLDNVGQSGTILCSNTQIACQAVAPCNASANLTTGCLYAQQHYCGLISFSLKVVARFAAGPSARFEIE